MRTTTNVPPRSTLSNMNSQLNTLQPTNKNNIPNQWCTAHKHQHAKQ